VASRLTVGQVRQLLAEHGSWEAAIEARPDLASQLRAFQLAADRASEVGRQLHEAAASTADQLRAFPSQTKPEGIDPEALAEYEIERQAMAHERALRRVRDAKGDPGRPVATMSAATFLTILDLGLRRAKSDAEKPSLQAISNRTGVPRQRVTPIADWVATNPSRAQHYLDLSEIPPPFRAIVAD
jgi:hypothetical protein